MRNKRYSAAMMVSSAKKFLPNTVRRLWVRRAIQLSFLSLGVILTLNVLRSYNVYYNNELGRACTVAEYQATKDESCVCYANKSGEKFTRASLLLEPEQPRCALTIFPQGRLGNLMGEYATLYALAKMNNRPAFIPVEMAIVLKRYFKISLPTLPEKFDAAMYKSWEKYELNDWMEDRHRNIPGTFVMLNGYPCSWTFYNHIREEILKEFTFNGKIRQDAASYLTNIKGLRSSVTYIGIHVRRGDYVDLMAGLYKGVLADKMFLRDSMAYFRAKFPDAIFVVASDDMLWSMKNIDNSRGDVYFAGNGDKSEPIRDFAILACCNHSIITIGTYGYWSAYLAGGETVYLVNYTIPDSVFMKVLKYDKSYLPEWIGFPANFDKASKAVSVAFDKLSRVKLVFYVLFYVICSLLLL